MPNAPRRPRLVDGVSHAGSCFCRFAGGGPSCSGDDAGGVSRGAGLLAGLARVVPWLVGGVEAMLASVMSSSSMTMGVLLVLVFA